MSGLQFKSFLYITCDLQVYRVLRLQCGQFTSSGAYFCAG